MRLRDDARLARAGAGEDQQRSVDVQNRFALFGVELSKNRIGIGHGIEGSAIEQA